MGNADSFSFISSSHHLCRFKYMSLITMSGPNKCIFMHCKALKILDIRYCHSIDGTHCMCRGNMITKLQEFFYSFVTMKRRGIFIMVLFLREEFNNLIIELINLVAEFPNSTVSCGRLLSRSLVYKIA